MIDLKTIEQANTLEDALVDVLRNAPPRAIAVALAQTLARFTMTVVHSASPSMQVDMIAHMAKAIVAHNEDIRRAH